MISSFNGGSQVVQSKIGRQLNGNLRMFAAAGVCVCVFGGGGAYGHLVSAVRPFGLLSPPKVTVPSFRAVFLFILLSQHSCWLCRRWSRSEGSLGRRQ
jgi:hypothetical protein